jgi:hypothetical protein
MEPDAVLLLPKWIEVRCNRKKPHVQRIVQLGFEETTRTAHTNRHNRLRVEHDTPS